MYDFGKENYVANTVWRFYGKCTLIEGYDIRSEPNEPLCFILKPGIGAVYLYGNGIVKSKASEQRLGYKI